MSRYYGGWAPYVPVAERRRKAEREMAKLSTGGHPVAPAPANGVQQFAGARHVVAVEHEAVEMTPGGDFERAGALGANFQPDAQRLQDLVHHFQQPAIAGQQQALKFDCHCLMRDGRREMRAYVSRGASAAHLHACVG